MRAIKSSVFMLLGACVFAPVYGQSPATQAGDGGIRVDPEISSGLIPYAPAESADGANGRLGELLSLHKASCAENDASAFYSLFNQKTRFLYTKVPQEKLAAHFAYACSDSFIGRIEGWYKAGEARIAPNGRTESGVESSALCEASKMEGGICRAGIEVSVEGGRLKWGWH